MSEYKNTKGISIPLNTHNIVLFMLIALLVYFAYLSMMPKNIIDTNNTPYKFFNYTEEEVLKTCNNLSLINTVRCVTTFEKGIYKPRITTDNTNQTLEELKRNGGDCRDWSNLEQKIFTDLGFFSGTLKYPLEEWNHTNETRGHQISYVIDGEQTCYIDNLLIWCTL